MTFIILNLPLSYNIAINYLKKSLLLLSNPQPPLRTCSVYSQKSTYVLLHSRASSDIKAVKWLELMWPDINTTLSSRACCTVILPRASCHENKFTWKLPLLCRDLPRSQGLPPVWCFSFYLPCGLVVSQPFCSWWKVWVFIQIQNANPADCGSMLFFSFFAAAESMILSSAKEGMARVGVKVRTRATSETFLPRLQKHPVTSIFHVKATLCGWLAVCC